MHEQRQSISDGFREGVRPSAGQGRQEGPQPDLVRGLQAALRPILWPGGCSGVCRPADGVQDQQGHDSAPVQ